MTHCFAPIIQTSKLSLDERQSFCLEGVYAQADLSLCWTHMQSCTKWCASAEISEILLAGFSFIKFLATPLTYIRWKKHLSEDTVLPGGWTWGFLWSCSLRKERQQFQYQMAFVVTYMFSAIKQIIALTSLCKPEHSISCNMHMRPSKTQVSLRIPTGWS